MPRACTVCAHPDRAAIEAAAGRGEPLRGLSRRHGLSKDALARHAAHAAHAGTKRDEKRDRATAPKPPRNATVSHARIGEFEFAPFPDKRPDRLRYVVEMMTSSPPTWERGKTGPRLAAFAGCSVGCIEDIAAEASRQIKNVIDKDYVRGRVAAALHEGLDIALEMVRPRPALTDAGEPILLQDGTPVMQHGDPRALGPIASLGKTWADVIGAGAPQKHEVTGQNGNPLSTITGLPATLAALEPSVAEVEHYIATGELPRRDPKPETH